MPDDILTDDVSTDEEGEPVEGDASTAVLVDKGDVVFPQDDADRPSVDWGETAQTSDANAQRVFTSQPTTPYTYGDVWEDGATVRICVFERNTGAFNADDWQDAETHYAEPVTTVTTVTMSEEITDFSPESIAAYQQRGATAWAVYTDGTRSQVEWSEVEEILPDAVVVAESALMAEASSQHFWTNSEDAAVHGGAGAHITDDTMDVWDGAVADGFSDLTAQKPYHNILLNSLGILLRSGLNNLLSLTRSALAFYDGRGNNAENIVARFGRAGAQIGASDAQHAVIDENGLAVYDGNGDLMRINSVDIVATHDAAVRAEADAEAAKESAAQAAGSASAAASSSAQAASSASAAQASSSAAQGSAANAEASATSAQNSASSAASSSASAASSASSAQSSAAAAASDARSANASANAALAQLGSVEDVIGVVNWVTEHGTYSPTEDTAVDTSKVYYSRSGSGTQSDPYRYSPVGEPTAEGLAGYYELSIDAALSQYVASHLALTDAGLYVQKDGSSWKTLTKADGWELQDDEGRAVLALGASGIGFNAEYAQHIGNEDAYILFSPANGDDPARIVIGGANIQLGSSKTLSEWEDQLAQAAEDADEARQAALDVPIVTLSSTNGTVFKRNLGVSTTLVATVFTPGGRISDAAELRRRFGAGAYLEWGWRDVVTDARHVLPSTDQRIGNGGFSLTVTPDDVDAQAVITCSLIC